MKNDSRSLVRNLVLTALFAALSAALSQIAFPINAVPIVLTQVSIFLAAGLLGWKWGALSQVLFVAMGTLGLPVFAGFSGGPGILAGPTGGFIVGYLISALVAGLLMDKLGHSFRVALPVLAFAALLVYLPGLPWLAHVLGLRRLKDAFLLGMLPYLPGDAIKVALCALVLPQLSKILRKGGAG